MPTTPYTCIYKLDFQDNLYQCLPLVLQVSKLYKNNFLFHNSVRLQYLNNILGCFFCNYAVFFFFYSKTGNQILQLENQLSLSSLTVYHCTVCQISAQHKISCYFVILHLQQLIRVQNKPSAEVPL